MQKGEQLSLHEKAKTLENGAKPQSIILSFSDIAQAIKKHFLFIVLVACFTGCASFTYLLLKPVHYTAKGVFSGHNTQSTTFLSKALEFLGKEETYLSSIDQRFLLRSTPILKGVVESLSLQATLTEKKLGSRIQEIWNTFKTAKAYRALKKKNTPSQILTPHVLTSDHLIIPDLTKNLICSHVCFSAETTLSLKIVFLTETTFKVFNRKQLLGIGEMDLPFKIPSGSFTLHGKGKKNKTVGLHLIPIQAAVESLQHSVLVAKNKENSALIDISYAHRDRFLAAQIVNAVMEQMQLYLIEEGKAKIEKQLLYLHQRKDETMQLLEDKLLKQKAFLEADLDRDIIVTLEKELAFVAKQQAEKKEELLNIWGEMQQLSQILYNEAIENHLENIRTQKEKTTLEVLTLDSARNLIVQHQHQLDLLALDKQRYDLCIEKLKDADFKSPSLSKILNDPSFAPRFEHIQKIHHNLIDEKNWTEKEREQLKQTLETEKIFLAKQIELLKEGAELHEQLVKHRIKKLEEDLLYLLFHRYIQIENTLDNLKKQASNFPQKWFNEQKLEIQTKIHCDIMEAITKMVESKNIGYNIDYLLSNSFQLAVPPLLPQNPQLLYGMLLGILCGSVLVVISICMYQVCLGPSASEHNLQALGLYVVPQKESIKKLSLALCRRGQMIVCMGKQHTAYIAALNHWLTQRGEKVYCLDLTQTSDTSFEDYKEKGEAFLASSYFCELLLDLKKQYDHLILLSESSPQSVETEILLSYADSVVYTITTERLCDLEPLSRETFFLMPSFKNPMFSLKDITPLLSNFLKEVKHSSFSLAQTAWSFFPAKKF